MNTQEKICKIQKGITDTFIKSNIIGKDISIIISYNPAGQLSIDFTSDRYVTQTRLFELYSNYSITLIWNNKRNLIKNSSVSITTTVQNEASIVTVAYNSLEFLKKNLHMTINGSRKYGDDYSFLYRNNDYINERTNKYLFPPPKDSQ